MDKIYYEGNELELDVDDTTNTAYYQHIYQSSFNYDQSPGRHMCLQWDAWCWKQAREYPIDAVRFILGRIFKSR